MKFLSFLVTVGILVSAVSAAPTNTDIQQEEYNGRSTKVQDWNTALHVLHGALGSYLNSGGKEAAEVERMTNAAELLQEYLSKFNSGPKSAAVTNNYIYDIFRKYPGTKQDKYDIMVAAIEGLPEEAQAQFWGTAGKLLLKAAPHVIPDVVDYFRG